MLDRFLTLSEMPASSCRLPTFWLAGVVSPLRCLSAMLLLAASTCAPAGPPPSPSEPRDHPYILVSALGASAIFPRENMRRWGWAEHASAPHVWETRIEGVEGMWALRWHVRRVQSPTAVHGSLGALLERGEGSLCRLEYGPVCEPVAVGAIAMDGRVSVGIADSTVVARIFGDRPRWATMVREQPGIGVAQVLDSIPIEYADPATAPPDATLRQRAAVMRQRFLTTATRIERNVSAGPAEDEPLWIGPGDTVVVTATELRCRDDRCLTRVPVASDQPWTTGDASVARVAPLAATVRSGPTGARAMLIGVSKGRTIVRIGGLRGEADTLHDGTVAASVAEREVIVADPIEVLWLRPRPDSLVTGQPVHLRVLGEGPLGDVIEEAPTGVIVVRGEQRVRYRGSEPPAFSFDEPGRHLIIPYAGMHAETLGITVMPRRPMRPVAAYARDRHHVLVSADEARFIFRRLPIPPGGWGWGRRGRGTVNWTVWLDGIGGRRRLGIGPPYSEGPAMEAAHSFTSLRDLVAYMVAEECHPIGIPDCSARGLSAYVEDGRVVLSLRDRAAIERFFRLRPGLVELDQSAPGDTSFFPEEVPVVYVDPQLAPPDREFLAYADRRRRELMARTSAVGRSIIGPRLAGDRIQLSVGDTVELATSESVSVDWEPVANGPLSVSGWSVQDSTVASLIAAEPAESVRGRRVPDGPRVRLVALAPGQTIVRAVGVRGVADTIVTRHPPPTEISRAVLVTPRFTRIAVFPRPEEVRTGEAVRFELRALDASGAHVPGIPGALTLARDNWSTTSENVTSRNIRFDRAGTFLVIGRVGSIADTIVVVAREP